MSCIAIQIKSYIQNIQNDCITIQNPAEAMILAKYKTKTKRVMQIFIGISVGGILMVILKLLLPTVLRLKYQLSCLEFFGFFYREQTKLTDWACVHLTATTAIGLLTFTCTEGSLAVFSLYLCGLFDIVSRRCPFDSYNYFNTLCIHAIIPLAAFLHVYYFYSKFFSISVIFHITWVAQHANVGLIEPCASFIQLFTTGNHICRIREAVNDASKLITANHVAIGPAMDMHQRAYKLANCISNDMVVSYLLAILVVIVSFAVNLYRAFLLILDTPHFDDTCMAITIVVTHMLVVFLNNYSGQQLANVSVKVYNETYNSLWYSIPPKSQKLLLFVLMRSTPELRYNIGGLFIPCYQGFTTMMSSSFSYFTVLYSI
ncbi:uncharacterized protein LOC143259621 isoform X3 [Megalopta genalis]|uniref:uncharacterized protein LOC143259621 isoform X3 n=1 Tax=Megalopta genalis TaxID=115081 RepID=UPI003FD0C570